MAIPSINATVVQHVFTFRLLHIFIAFVACLCLVLGARADESDGIYNLRYLLNLARQNPEEAVPTDSIYSKNSFLYCTGQSKLAEVNNQALGLMEKGDYTAAAVILENGLEQASLFFPFRYNLGMCYFFLDQLQKAMLQFKKAELIVPEYARTYLQIGNIYQRWYRDNEAIDYYKKALKSNRKELETFVLIGDLFLKRNQIQVAKKYYDAALKDNPRYSNGLLGRAKIHFRQGEYYKAIILCKSIDLSGDYDKAYHYYYAESAFKLRDYPTAVLHYQRLLEFKTDVFFLSNSSALIQHKLNLARRFTEN